MIVDTARNARRTIMYFFALSDPIPAGQLIHAQPAQVEVLSASLGLFAATRRATKVRWYQAPKGAKPLPFPTAFALSDFLSKWERVEVKYGEDPFYRWQWDNGSPPQGATGQYYCGTPEDFDVPKKWSPDLPTLCRGPTGLPCCCAPVACASLVLTANPIDVNGSLGRGENIAQGDGYLGLFGEISGEFCGGALEPLQLRVRILSTDYPELDGRIMYLPQVPRGQPEIEWGEDYPLGADTLRVSVEQAYAPLFGETFALQVQWGDFSPFGPGYLYAAFISGGGFSCSPFSFSHTMEAFNIPAGTPTGKFITFETF
jgi:hypothetical protein